MRGLATSLVGLEAAWKKRKAKARAVAREMQVERRRAKKMTAVVAGFGLEAEEEESVLKGRRAVVAALG